VYRIKQLLNFIRKFQLLNDANDPICTTSLPIDIVTSRQAGFSFFIPIILVLLFVTTIVTAIVVSNPAIVAEIRSRAASSVCDNGTKSQKAAAGCNTGCPSGFYSCTRGCCAVFTGETRGGGTPVTAPGVTPGSALVGYQSPAPAPTSAPTQGTVPAQANCAAGDMECLRSNADNAAQGATMTVVTDPTTGSTTTTINYSKGSNAGTSISSTVGSNHVVTNVSGKDASGSSLYSYNPSAISTSNAGTTCSLSASQGGTPNNPGNCDATCGAGNWTKMTGTATAFCGTVAPTATPIPTVSPTIAVTPSPVLTPILTPTVVPLAAGTCAGGNIVDKNTRQLRPIRAGDLILGPKNHVVQCGASGKYTDVSSQGYTFDDLTYIPPGITRTDSTAMATFQAALGGGAGGGSPCGGLGSSVISSGTVAEGPTASKRAKCVNGKWVDCPGCLFSGNYVPDWAKTNAAYQQEVASYNTSLDVATKALLDAYNACLSKFTSNCYDQAKASVPAGASIQIKDAALAQYTATIKLNTVYYPTLKVLKDCEAAHPNDPSACAAAEHGANLAYAQTGLPADVKTKETVYDTQGYQAYLSAGGGGTGAGSSGTVPSGTSNYAVAFQKYQTDYQKSHPSATQADALTAFQAEQTKVWQDMIPKLVALGQIKNPSDPNDPFMQAIQNGTAVATDFQAEYAKNKNSSLGMWLLLSFNEMSQGATKKGNDLVNSACYGTNKNAYDCVRGGLIQGAAPAAVIAAVPAAIIFAPLAGTAGFIAVGSTALGVGATTFSLQQTAEACASNTIVTKECGTAAAWTVFSGVTTGLGAVSGAANASLRAAQAAAGLDGVGNLAKTGAELVQVADETVALRQAVNVATLTNQAAQVVKVEKYVSLAGTVLFGSQAVDACKQGLSLQCGINAAAAAFSGVRTIAAFTGFAQTSEAAAKALQAASKAESVGVGGGFAVLSCGSALTTHDYIGCTQALGFAAVGAGGIIEGAKPGATGQTSFEISEKSPAGKYEAARQELAALYDAQGKLLVGVDPAIVTPKENALRVAIQQKAMYDAMVQVAAAPVKGIETAGTKGLVASQKVYQDALTVYNKEVANLPAADRLSDPRFIVLEQAKQALIDAKGTVTVETRALADPRNILEKVANIFTRPTEVSALQKAQADLLAEGSRVDITTAEGKRVYDQYLNRALTAKVAVENLRLTAEQRTIAAAQTQQNQVIADLNAQITPLGEKIALIDAPAKAQEALTQATEQLSKAKSDRAALGGSEVHWDGTKWVGSDGHEVPSMIIGIQFDAVSGKWKVAATGTELDGVQVSATQNSLLQERRNYLDSLGDQLSRNISDLTSTKLLADANAAHQADAITQVSALKTQRDGLQARVAQSTIELNGMAADYAKAGSVLARIGIGRAQIDAAVVKTAGLDTIKENKFAADILDAKFTTEKVNRIGQFSDTLTQGAAAKANVLENPDTITTAATAREAAAAKQALLDAPDGLITQQKTAVDALKKAAAAVTDPTNKVNLEIAQKAADDLRSVENDMNAAKKQIRVLSRMQTLMDNIGTLEAKAARTPSEGNQLAAAQSELNSLKTLQDVVINTGDAHTDLVVRHAMLQQEASVNDVRGTKVSDVFSFRDTQVQYVTNFLANKFVVDVLTTSGGKTSAVAPLLMQLGSDLYGRTGVYMTKEGGATEAYNTMRANLGDKVFLFTQGSDYITLRDQYKNGSKQYMVMDGGSLAYLRNETIRPDISPEAQAAAVELYKIATQNVQGFMDEAPTLLDPNIQYISPYGEAQVFASADQKVGIRTMGTILASDAVKLLTGGSLNVLAAKTPDGQPYVTKSPEGTSYRWTEAGVRDIFTRLSDQGIFDEGGHVDLAKRQQAIDLAVKAGFKDPGASQFITDNTITDFVQAKVGQYADILNKYTSMFDLKRGTNAFLDPSGNATLGRVGTEAPSQRDNAIVTALAREVVTATLYEKSPNLDHVFVNGDAVRSTMFDIVGDMRVGNSALSASTGTLGEAKAVANLLFDKVTDNPEASSRFFGVRDPVSNAYSGPTKVWLAPADISRSSTQKGAVDAYFSDLKSDNLDIGFNGAENVRHINGVVVGTSGMPVADVAAIGHAAAADYHFFARYPDGHFYEITFDPAGRPVQGPNADTRVVNVNHAEPPVDPKTGLVDYAFGIPDKSIVIIGEGGVEGTNVIMGSGQTFSALIDADRSLAFASQATARSNRAGNQPQRVKLYVVATDQVPVDKIPPTQEGLYDMFHANDLKADVNNRTLGTGIAQQKAAMVPLNDMLAFIEADAKAAPAGNAAAIEANATRVRQAVIGVQNAQRNALETSFVSNEKEYLPARQQELAAAVAQYKALLANPELEAIVKSFEVPGVDPARSAVAAAIRTNASVDPATLTFADPATVPADVSQIGQAKSLAEFITLHNTKIRAVDVNKTIASSDTTVTVARTLSDVYTKQLALSQARQQGFLEAMKLAVTQAVPAVNRNSFLAGLFAPKVVPVVGDDEAASKAEGLAAARASLQIAAGLAVAEKSPGALTATERQNLLTAVVASGEIPGAAAGADAFDVHLPNGSVVSIPSGSAVIISIVSGGKTIAQDSLATADPAAIAASIDRLRTGTETAMTGPGASFTSSGSIQIVAGTSQQSSPVSPIDFASNAPATAITTTAAETALSRLSAAYEADIAARLAGAAHTTPTIITTSQTGLNAVGAILSYELSVREALATDPRADLTTGDVAVRKRAAQEQIVTLLTKILASTADSGQVLTDTTGSVVNAYTATARTQLSLTRAENFRAVNVAQIIAGTQILSRPFNYLSAMWGRVAAIFYRGEPVANKPAIITPGPNFWQRLAANVKVPDFTRTLAPAAPVVTVKIPAQIITEALVAAGKIETSGSVPDANLRISVLAGLVALEKDPALSDAATRIRLQTAYETDVAFRLALAVGMTMPQVQAAPGGNAAITAIATR